MRIYTEGDILKILNKEELVEVKIFNTSGSMLLRSVESTINLSAYQSGIYIVKAGEVVTKIKR